MTAFRRRTKILATLGPASDGALKMEELLRAGVDLFRLNFSHGSHAEHAARIAAAREAEKSTGRPVALLADLQGPKLRIGDLTGGVSEVRMSSELRLRPAASSNDPEIIPIPHPELVASLQLGDKLLKRGKQHLMTGPAVCIGLACPLLVAGLLSPSWPLAIGLFFPGIALLWLHVGPAYSAVQGLVPSFCRATASATILLMQNLFGLGLGATVIGKLSDHYKPLYGVDSVRMVLAVLVGVVTLAAAAFFWASRRHLPEELDRFDGSAHDAADAKTGAQASA